MVTINLEKVCLLCLSQADLRCMFETYSGEHTIVDKIAQISDLKLKPQHKDVTSKICRRCIDDLSIAWRFHQSCKTAAMLLQQESPSRQSNQQQAKASKNLKQIKVQNAMTSNQSFLITVPEEEDESVSQGALLGVDEQFIENDMEIIDEELLVTDDESEHLDDSQEQQSMQEHEIDKGFEALDVEDEMDAMRESASIDGDEAVEYTYFDELDNNEELKQEQIAIVKAEPEERAMRKINLAANANNNNAIIIPVSNVNKSIARPTRTLKQRKVIKLSSGSKSENIKEEFQELSDAQGQDYELVEFEEEPELKRKRKGTVRPPKICDICGNSYKYQHSLNAHMRRHNKQKPYACECCEKAFVSAVELRRHMRVHTGHKPYACQFCDRRFSDFGSRIKHERTHTGERPYKCETCGKRFAYAHVLSVHTRVHTGEKRFQCDVCGRGFTKKAYLVAHRDQHVRYETILPTNESNEEELAIKTVALEECIMTTETEYIEEESRSCSDENLDSQHGNQDYIRVVRLNS